MKNVNIGIANLVISNKLKESYFNNTLISESKKVAFDFLDVVKNSPALQLEFKVYNGIEEQHIENELQASKYIDNAIKLFEIYAIEEIEAEHAKLAEFLQEDLFTELNEADYDPEKVKLYDAIDGLITETLKYGDDVDIDKLHESYIVVLNYIKEPKKGLLENVDVELIDENVLEIATRKFNEKYDGLNEDDRNLLQKLIKSGKEEKKSLFEAYKTETLTILEGITDDTAKVVAGKAIKKINEMVYSDKEVEDHIIGLHELKKELM